MALNSIDEVYVYIGFDKSEIRQSLVQQCLDDAAGYVEIQSPLDLENARSMRLQPLRALAEKNYAAYLILINYSNVLFASNPPVRVLSVLQLSAGGYTPTMTEIVETMRKQALGYKELADEYVRQLKPFVSSLAVNRRCDIHRDHNRHWPDISEDFIIF